MRTEGNVNTKDFRYIVEQLSFVVFIDLFASRLNKLVYFMSNRPDSEYVSVDAFTQSWEGLCIPYVNMYF